MPMLVVSEILLKQNQNKDISVLRTTRRSSKMENKNKRNENKVILEDFNCTMDKMGRDGGTKTQSI